MNKFKYAIYVIAIVIVSYVVNIIAIILSSETGVVKTEIQGNCLSVSYEKSGFPIREVYLEPQTGEGCGSGIDSGYGDMHIGDTAFAVNWAFYFILILLLYKKYVKKKV